MTRFTLAALACAPFLAACVAAAPPASVALPDGRQGLQITASAQDTQPLTPASAESIGRVLEGPGRGNLADRARVACPGGYDITDRTPVDSQYSMLLANGVPLYRVSQTFTVACR